LRKQRRKGRKRIKKKKKALWILHPFYQNSFNSTTVAGLLVVEPKKTKAIPSAKQSYTKQTPNFF